MWPSFKLYIVVIACPFLFVMVIYRINVSMVRALYPAEYMGILRAWSGMGGDGGQ